MWIVERRFQGQRDTPLNERGREQARRLAERLRAQPLSAVYSSDLSRAVDTARAIAEVHGLPVLTDAALREVHYGDWEGLTMEEVGERWSERLNNWRRVPLENPPPHGETLEEVVARVKVKTNEIVSTHPDATVAVVGHSGSLKAAMLWALGKSLAEWRTFQIDNASISVLQFRCNGVDLVRLNDTSHLCDISTEELANLY